MTSQPIHKVFFFLGSLLIGFGLGMIIEASTFLSSGVMLAIVVISFVAGGFLLALGLFLPREEKPEDPEEKPREKPEQKNTEAKQSYKKDLD